MKPKSLSSAKITKPRVGQVTLRERLFHRLDEYRKYPATWIGGPAGSGKTTLVASYVNAGKLSCLWYQVDAGDADIATFFYYMGLACKKAAPQIKTELPLLTPEYSQGIPIFTKRFFEQLYDRLKKPSVVVLDNYQEVPEGSMFHEVVREAMSVIPENIHVMVLSRKMPPQAFIRMQANAEMEILGWEDLRFNAAETRELVQVLYQKADSEDLVKSLQQKTGGWIAGLYLVLKHADIADLQPQSVSERTPEQIFDYFAHELFENAEDRIKQFLLKTCILPRMNSKMAFELTGLKDAEKILLWLNRENYFTDKRVANVTTFQYHPLFREFLIARAQDSLPSDELAKLKEKTALLLEADGQSADAMTIFLASNFVDAAVRLCIKEAPKLISQGRHMTLEKWLNRLPESVFKQNPWLYYWLGACRMPYEPPQALSNYQKALDRFEKLNDVDGIFLSLYGLLESIFLGFGSSEPLDEWLPKAEKICSDYPEFPSPDIEARVVYALLTSVTFRKPNHPAAPMWEERLLSLLHDPISMEIKGQIMTLLITRGIFRGDFAAVAHHITTFRGLTQSLVIPPFVVLTFSTLAVLYYWLCGELSKARKTVQEALMHAADTGVYRYMHFLHGHGAAAALSSGDLNSAKHHLKHMKENLNLKGAWEQEYYHTLATWFALLQERAADADFHSDMLLKGGRRAGMMSTVAVDYLGRALALFLTGDLESARGRLDEALEISRAYETRQIEFGCHLVMAEFALHEDDDEQMIAALENAMSLGKKQSYYNSYFWRAKVMAKLCARALDADIEVAYVQRLIQKRGLIPEKSSRSIKNWPWPVQVFTLGRFQLNVNGSPLAFSGKIPRKPLSLLKTLIALGGQDVSVPQIMDGLWPDLDGDAAQRAFKVCLHRLRKLLVHERAVILSEEKLAFNSTYCWVDILHLTGLLKEAETKWRLAKDREQQSEAAGISEYIVSNLIGPFLPDDDDPLVMGIRNKLNDRLLSCINALAGHYQNLRLWEKAAACYNQGIELDPVSEALYQKLMRCYARLDSRSLIIQTFELCETNLSRLSGLKPSSETVILYRSLI